MNHNESEPYLDEQGYLTHPSWGSLRANRVQSTGQRLFDSEVTHQEYVIITLSSVVRKRDIQHDWIHEADEKFEVAMSLSQWGAFVSSFGQGSACPVTITREGFDYVDSAPFESRLAVSMAETREAAHRAFDAVQEAVADVQAVFDAKGGRKAMAEALHTLEARINNAPKNVEYSAKTLSGHAEAVVNKAKADIEGMIDRRAQMLGIEAPTVAVGELMSADPDIVAEANAASARFQAKPPEERARIINELRKEQGLPGLGF